MVDRVGQQFGNYRLVRLLGRGGFAEVYLGEHIHLGTQAAVKVLYTHLTSEHAEQFRNEARVIAHFEHPHIVRVFDFGIEGGIPFFVMSYASGGTLRQRHPRGTRIPLATVISYVNQIAPALQYAHFRKRIHRDIKPENILIGANSHLVLSDFGISVVAHSTLTRETQNASGTPVYMAPEHFLGQAEVRSDQYSLGVVVYEWLCGEPPFTKGDMGYQHSHVPPPPLRSKVPSLSPLVEQVVMRALKKDPHKRFVSVQAFAKALEQACSAEQQPFIKLFAGTLLYTYQVPQGNTCASCWTAHGPRIASGDTGGRIEVWDIATGSFVSMNRAHSTEVETIVWSPDGNFIASFAPGDGMIQVWDASNGSRIVTYTDVILPVTSRIIKTYGGYRAAILQSIAWSPDSVRFAFSRANNDDDIVQVCNIRSKKYILISQGASVLAWSPDGTRISSLAYDQKTDVYLIQIWRADTGDDVATCYLDGKPGLGPWHLSEANFIWAPNSTHLACHVVYYWSGVRKLVSPLPVDDPASLTSSQREAISKAIEENQAKYNPSGIEIWQADTGRKIITHSRAKAPAWSPNSNQITFVKNNRTVEVWDVATKGILGTYRDHSASILTVAWSPDNKHIASASIDGAIHIWDALSTRRIFTLDSDSQAVTTITWSPDGNQIASISQNRTVRVWQIM